LLANALEANPELHVIAIVPRFPDKQGVGRWPSLVGRELAIKICRSAGGERFGIYDVENHAGTPVYVHAKAVVIDDVWAMVGSDNLNRRSWTHDSELSCAVLDEATDPREPVDPAGIGDGARVFARDLRLELWREHLDRGPEDPVEDLLDPTTAFRAMRDSAQALRSWHDSGQQGARPPGRLCPHVPERMSWWRKVLAVPVYRWLYDPDGRALRDRVRRKP
jgi:phosphatidylserine/phosphatidylglycerophosphate/cardiolipin synthase-like enzyme